MHYKSYFIVLIKLFQPKCGAFDDHFLNPKMLRTNKALDLNIYKTLKLPAQRCVFKWHLSFEEVKKADPQILQGKGLSPVCIRRWTWRLELWAKFAPQTSHTNGFSPVCVLVWSLRLDLHLNLYPQNSVKGFSSSVCPYMVIENWTLWKSRYTDYALKGLLPCVSS